MVGSKVGVVFGRFSGVHKFHMGHIIRATNENDMVMIFVGSSNRRVSIKNPFTAEERIKMLEMEILSARVDGKIPAKTWIAFRLLPDDPYHNDRWADRAKVMARSYARDSDITVYGCDKDSSTFYFKLFPEWKQSLAPEDESHFNATALRTRWFKDLQMTYNMDHLVAAGFISHNLIQYLDLRPFDKNLQLEWNFYKKEQERFADYPFPETLTFNCGDAVVVWRGHVLFIKRGSAPGKGCWATPGGFKNRNETGEQAAEREFYEETRMNIPPAALEKCKRKVQLFDDPSRSLGIPRSTVAVLYDVSEMFDTMPEVYPADDAVDYVWCRIEGIDDIARQTYDDHGFMIKEMLS